MRPDDLTFSTDGKLLFHGIYTGLTRENLEDIRFDYGIEPTDVIIKIYEQLLPIIRDKKIKQILDSD